MTDLADRLEAFAAELLAPLRCTTPAGNPEPGMHCAACCYGTGYLLTCEEDQLVLDLADQARTVAAALRGGAHRPGWRRVPTTPGVDMSHPDDHGLIRRLP
jgi:hypothetical protein